MTIITVMKTTFSNEMCLNPKIRIKLSIIAIEIHGKRKSFL